MSSQPRAGTSRPPEETGSPRDTGSRRWDGGRSEELPAGPPRRKALIAAAIGVGVLVLAAAGLLVTDTVRAQRAEERRAAARAAAGDAARDAVQTYLQALVDADAEAALAQARTAPAGTLLTDEVLAASQERGGLAEPTTTGADLEQDADGRVGRGTVTARYTVAGQERSVTYDVTNTPGGWRLDDVTATATLGAAPVRVNGVTASGEQEVFPGAYDIAATSDRVVLDEPAGSVTDPAEPVDWAARPTLSEKGRRDAIEAGRRALDACLARKELTPAGCPMIQWRPGDIAVDTPTITYTLEGDPWAEFEPRLSDDGRHVTGMLTTAIHLSADASRGDASGRVNDTQTSTVAVSIDIAAARPAVEFRG